MRRMARLSTISPSSRRRRVTGLVGSAVLAANLASGVASSPSAGAVTPGANGKIAFTSGRNPNGHWDIFVMNADGTGVTNLIDDNGDTGAWAIDLAPAWSPDGKRIAWARADRSDFDWGIWVMNADGKNKRQLTSTTDLRPTWSPDGERIAFSSHRDGNFELYVMDADGNNQTRLTTTAADEDHPEWSPDGQWIAYQGDWTGHNEIYMLNVDNPTIVRQLTWHSVTARDPSWSPDGSRLAFSMETLDSNTGKSNVDVYTLSFLTDPYRLTRLTDDAAIDAEPSWAPDGDGIVFVRYAAGEHEIFSMDAGGGNQTQLTQSPGIDVTPAWQPLKK